MNKLLNNILIPVFSANGLMDDVESMLEIATSFQGNVHLACVLNDGRFRPFRRSRLFLSAARKIKINRKELDAKLQMERLSKLYPFVVFNHAVFHRDPKSEIADYCKKHHIDIILLPEKKAPEIYNGGGHLNNYPFLFTQDLPILAVHFHNALNEIKNIVIPVGNFLPVRRLVIASYIGKLFHSTIHLVSVNKKLLVNGYDEAVCMYKAYHLLRDNTNLRVECNMLPGKDITNVSLQYAEKISAELVLINSDEHNMYEAIAN
ncbi:MAG: hypothetical protein JST96_11740 [Bacteroidetes bacterium]|nr:hypothetical protein [Bacteroidota bacterium]